jgi:catalase
VQSTIVRQRVIDQLNYIDFDLARRVAYYIGAEMPTKFMGTPSNMTSPSLSISNYPKTTIRGRTVAILVADGVNIAEVTPVMDALMAKGVLVTIISGKLGPVKVTGGSGSLMANATYGTTGLLSLCLLCSRLGY